MKYKNIVKGKFLERPNRFISYCEIEYKIENYTLLVGKNNIQNDYLTTKLAKSTDIWFHTKEIHGSHAILQTHGETPSIDVIIRCAQIAAYYSKAKQSSTFQ